MFEQKLGEGAVVQGSPGASDRQLAPSRAGRKRKRPRRPGSGNLGTGKRPKGSAHPGPPFLKRLLVVKGGRCALKTTTVWTSCFGVLVVSEAACPEVDASSNTSSRIRSQ